MAYELSTNPAEVALRLVPFVGKEIRVSGSGYRDERVTHADPKNESVWVIRDGEERRYTGDELVIAYSGFAIREKKKEKKA